MAEDGLYLEGLTRRYGAVTALADLTFAVPPAQVVGFLGPNGAGKTTTMRAIFGLVELEAGDVAWRGRPIDAAARRRFGYMPEERGLYPTMQVREQLEYFARLHGLGPSAARERAVRWLERLGIADRADTKLEALSHGNQQRAQLCAALVHDPELLVLDEPLTGLDPGGIDEISEVLSERARAGVSVLLSSHQLDLVEDLCESVVIIDHGRLVTKGTVRELTTSGAKRLSVRVESVVDPTWARALCGVTVSEVHGDSLRLVLEEGVDSDLVLRAAMAQGRVTEFAFERRRLSEVFREAMA